MGRLLTVLDPVTTMFAAERNVSVFNRVVLPAPLDPMIASNSPGCAMPETVKTDYCFNISANIKYII